MTRLKTRLKMTRLKRIRKGNTALSRKLRRRFGMVFALGALSMSGLVVAIVFVPRKHVPVDAELPATAMAAEALQIPPIEDPWSFFRPAWKKSTVTVSLQEQILTDPLHRMEPDFLPPLTLRPRVLFWLRVYTEGPSYFRYIHDRHQPWIVYGTLDLKALHRVLGSSVLFDVKANEIERKVLKLLKAKLSDAVGLTHTGALSLSERTEVQNYLSSIGALSPDVTQHLIDNIRTQTGQRDIFLKALERSKDLLPHIESVFRQQHVPVALARIPFVESSFNHRATSKIGAIGLWQFTPETAREWISKEERKLWSDPLRQTRSAAKLLKLWRTVLPDWGITVTAYNSGIGRMRRLAAKHRLKRYDQIFYLADNDLGFAGQNFYSELLAANLAERYRERFFQKEFAAPQPKAVALKPFPRTEVKCETLPTEVPLQP